MAPDLVFAVLGKIKFLASLGIRTPDRQTLAFCCTDNAIQSSCFLWGKDSIFIYSLYEIHAFQSRAMAWTVSCRHFTADYRVRSQVSTCQIYVRQNNLGQVIGFYSVSIIPLISHTHSFIYILRLAERQTGEGWELSNMQSSFREGTLCREELSLFRVSKG